MCSPPRWRLNSGAFGLRAGQIHPCEKCPGRQKWMPARPAKARHYKYRARSPLVAPNAIRFIFNDRKGKMVAETSPVISSTWS